MELKGQQKINATRDAVFAALNDPEILKQCIPGCQTLEKTSDTEMTATVVLKIGPIKAKFKGAVELSNLNPPESYTISGEGKGGAAGFARGGADVKLVEDGDGTLLEYSVQADIGGKLAQLGGRLIDSTAKKLAGQFFEKFGEIVGTDSEGTDGGSSDSPSKNAEKPETGSPKKWMYLVGAVLIVGAVYLLAR